MYKPRCAEPLMIVSQIGRAIDGNLMQNWL
jgi:hypothetical protein